MRSGLHPCENSRWRNGWPVRPTSETCPYCSILSNLIRATRSLLELGKSNHSYFSLILSSSHFFFRLPNCLGVFHISHCWPAASSYTRTSPSTVILRGRSFNSAQTDQYSEQAGRAAVAQSLFACVPITLYCRLQWCLNQLQLTHYIFRCFCFFERALYLLPTASLSVLPAWISVSWTSRSGNSSLERDRYATTSWLSLRPKS